MPNPMAHTIDLGRGRRADSKGGTKMRALKLLPICAVLTISTVASAQTVDWQKVDSVLGRTGAVNGDVHRYGFPRSDLQVTLDGVTIKPALALGGWTAFKPAH